MNVKVTIKSHNPDMMKPAMRTISSIAELIEKKHMIQEITQNGKYPKKGTLTTINTIPKKVIKMTLLRSPHVYKKSREQLEMRVYKSLIQIKNMEDKNTAKLISHIRQTLNTGFSVTIQKTSKFRE